MIKFTAVIAAFALFSAPALAAPDPGAVSLEGTVKIARTVTVDGVEKIVVEEPKVVVPGDKLLFATRYANKGTEAIANFVVTNPVPSAVIVADESAQDADVSVDGGKTFGPLATLQVKDEAGAPRAAKASDITHMRWTIAAIPPGGSGVVEYHAIVR